MPSVTPTPGSTDSSSGSDRLYAILSPRTACALISKDDRTSYDDLLIRIRYWARQLPGATARVVVFGENSPAWVTAAYALWCNGATLVPVDHLSTPEELAYVLDDCTPGLIVCSKSLLATVELGLAKAQHQPKVTLLEDLPREIPPVSGSVAPLEVAKSHLAAIVYTSGTTGQPKGVMLSFGNLLANVLAVVREGYFTPDARVLLLLPLHHVLPLAGSLLAPLFAGSTVVFAPSLAGEDLISTLRQHAITTIVGVPRFYDLLQRAIRERIDRSRLARTLFALARRLRSHAFSRLVFRAVHRKFGGAIRHLISGGAALSADTAETLDVLGFRICEGYGMTECAPMITFPRLHRLKIGSCGQVLDGCEAATTPEGEIIVRGPNVMLGYYHRPEETRAIVRDGWLHTGDLGHFDDEGYLYVTGRLKETLVLSSGKKLNPATVEATVEATNQAVRELGVFLDGDALHAILVPNREQVPADQRAHVEPWLRTAAIEPYNATVAPYRRITKLTIVDEPLPRTRLGKLRRHQLPELARRHAAAPNAAEQHASSDATAQLLGFLRRQYRQQVYPSSRLSADLGLDSLGRVELAVFIQRAFGIDLPEARLADAATVDDLAQLVDETPHTSHSDSGASTEISWSELLHPAVPPPIPQSSVFHWLIIWLSRIFVRAFFRMQVHGLPGDAAAEEPFILVANHQSYFDGLFVTAFLPPAVVQRTLFYAKERHVRGRWARFLAPRCNTIVVDPRHGYLTSLQQLAAGLAQRKNVIIFPEGTRSRDGSLGTFKDSYAILARELGVSILPVLIDGAYAALPESGGLPTRRAPIRVHYLPPVRTDPSEQPSACNARVHALLESALERTRREHDVGA